jgi:hypothetical protein
VTKADLILSRGHSFWPPADGQDRDDDAFLSPGYWRRRAAASDEARTWLDQRTGGNLEPLAARFEDASYFFISNYGYVHKPHTDTLQKPPEPMRVHEPIFALLDRLTEPAAAPRAALSATASVARGGRRAAVGGGDPLDDWDDEP